MSYNVGNFSGEFKKNLFPATAEIEENCNLEK